jgi:two-component system, LytTR family, response regulator
MNIRTLIVDDEPHAREGMRIRLSAFPEISIIGECSSGNEATIAINKLKPDLLFLDIQMPEMNGFEILQKINIDAPPIVVFVTAFDKYALKAFEFHALDYLLKPISEERLAETIKLVVTIARQKSIATYATRLRRFVDEYVISNDNSFEVPQITGSACVKIYINRLMIKMRDQISIIPVWDVEWIESAGDYVYVHSTGKKHLFRETLTALEQKLDPAIFIRIHRSTIVNLEKIKSLRQNEHGDYDVFLVNGIRLKLSRTYRNQFQKIVGNTF